MTKLSAVLAVLTLSVCGSSVASGTTPPADTNLFTLYLSDGVKGGKFFGPGDTGTHELPAEAQVRNLMFIGPLTGVIPFFNNGPGTPNVLAETDQGGVVDGLTSTGVPINENIDTGLMLDLKDASTGEAAKIMVVAVAQENIIPDAKGNLVFNPSVIADPGTSLLAVPFNVTFTTGARRVPLSFRTQMGMPGGHDNAGPIASGYTLIGRVGDFNQDGYMDGILVQAENSPHDLIIANGDPIAQIRPWYSNIPIQPETAALLSLNGTVNNYPEPLMEVIQQYRLDTAQEYTRDIVTAIDSALGNISRALHQKDDNRKHRDNLLAKNPFRDTLMRARKLLKAARHDFVESAEELGENEIRSASQRLEQGFLKSGKALQALAELGQ
jgi:hypothetical protein